MVRLELSGLVMAIVGIDVAARLAVPASLLFLTSGAAGYAAAAAGLVSTLAVIRGVLAGLHVVRTVSWCSGAALMGMLSGFFSCSAPVGQVSMHPPQSSQVVSIRLSSTAVEIVLWPPRPVTVMAFTASTSSQ